LTPDDFNEVFDRVVDSYHVRIPTYVNVSKKQRKAVNLNVYRNLHHHHLNTQKKNFADEVTPYLRDKPRAEEVWIHYTVFTPSRRRLDTMNVGSIADKYFSDTMVEAKKIEDDNTDHIVLSTFSFGGLTDLDGHAIATINILKPKENPDMRILLDQDDIQTALNAYVKTLNFPNADTATVDLDITADGQIEAEVIMGNAPVKNKGGRPRKARAKPTTKTKEEVTDAPEESADSGDEGSGSDTDSGSGESATPDVEEGAEAPADKPKTEKTTGSKSKNLFGEEENQSSESVETKTEDNPPKKTVVNPGAKKSSIFDVD
jgi:hypothetical protein